MTSVPSVVSVMSTDRFEQNQVYPRQVHWKL
ncbi:MAG: hypothetical protein CM15mP106_1170 [Candidatus Neomarinimicrobiota bacterium]|nr:MAG: hypothetical protein CM15mP106_1170 [Candidatus Neomarinimicrobiota bacterium]